MAKLTNMPAMDIVNGFKGTIDYYVHDGIPCARSWPRSQGNSQTPASVAQWPVFTTAVHLWNQLSLPVKEAYQQMTTGTNLTARDMFIKGYIAGTLRFFYLPGDTTEE